MLLRSSEMQSLDENGERIDPRISRSRHLLEQAFIDLLFEKGLNAVTVRDVTERAGINRATFYAHYEDKYALFTYLIEKRLDDLIQTRLPKDATFTHESLVLLVLALIDFFQSGNDGDCAAARNQRMRPVIESRAQEQIATLLRTWLHATPHLHLRADEATTATLISWMLFGLSLTHVRSGHQQTDYAEISNAVGVILHGAVASKEGITEGNTVTPNRQRVMSNSATNRLLARRNGQGAIVT